MEADRCSRAARGRPVHAFTQRRIRPRQRTSGQMARPKAGANHFAI
jgi:hypothetical protein